MVSDALVDLENAPNRHNVNQKTSLDVSKYRVENEEEEEEEEAEEEEEEGECDDASSVSSAGLDCDNNSGAVVLQDARHDRSPCFQNIEVSNSSDVHFGNKTIYQGPVTIKQILYTNPNNSDEQSASSGVVGEGTLPIANGTQNDNGFAADYVADRAAAKDGTASATNNSNWTGKSKGKKWLQSRTSKQLIIGTIVLMLIVVCIVAVTIILLTTYLPENTNGSIQHITVGEEPDINEPDNDPEDPDVNITVIPKWVDRKNWLARPEEPGVAPLKTPVPYVVIHHTATEQCHWLADCKAQVQSIQTFHMLSNKWSDIGYNFLVGGDGYIYEGRGFTKMGAHVKGYNNVSIGIAFIGLFDTVLPPKKSLLAAQEIMKVGVERNYIKKEYKILAMRQLSTFKSPGQKLYELIKTWPHWSPTL